MQSQQHSRPARFHQAIQIPPLQVEELHQHQTLPRLPRQIKQVPPSCPPHHDQTQPAAHTAHVFSPEYKLDSRTVPSKGARAKLKCVANSATEPSNKSWSATTSNCHRLLLSVPSQMSHSGNTESPTKIRFGFGRCGFNTRHKRCRRIGRRRFNCAHCATVLAIPSHFILDFTKQVSSTQANFSRLQPNI